MALGAQIVWLLVLAIPVAAVSWTITHEEVFREFREYALTRSRNGHSMAERKFFYLFTCEYCFSHYVSISFLIITGYQLLYSDWRGSLIAFFSVVWVANIYMGIFGQVKLGVKKERVEIKAIEKDADRKEAA